MPHTNSHLADLPKKPTLTERVEALEGELEAVKAGKHKRPKKKPTKVKDSTGRAARLGIWFTAGTVAAPWLVETLNLGELLANFGIDHPRKVVAGAVAVVLAKAWGEIEERWDFGILRNIPSPPAPVVDK